MKRKHIAGRKARRLFTATAKKVNKRNISPAPMRGGIRM